MTTEPQTSQPIEQHTILFSEVVPPLPPLKDAGLVPSQPIPPVPWQESEWYQQWLRHARERSQ